MAAEYTWVGLSLAALTGLGTGTIATAVTKYWLDQRSAGRQLRFTERKEAFIALLAAIAELDHLGGESTPEGEITYTHAVARVQLVASRRVLGPLAVWRDPEPNTPERNKMLEALLTAMRSDLGLGEDDS